MNRSNLQFDPFRLGVSPFFPVIPIFLPLSFVFGLGQRGLAGAVAILFCDSSMCFRSYRGACAIIFRVSLERERRGKKGGGCLIICIRPSLIMKRGEGGCKSENWRVGVYVYHLGTA